MDLDEPPSILDPCGSRITSRSISGASFVNSPLSFAINSSSEALSVTLGIDVAGELDCRKLGMPIARYLLRRAHGLHEGRVGPPPIDPIPQPLRDLGPEIKVSDDVPIMSRLSSGIEKSSGGAFLTNSARAAAIFLAVSRSTVWRFLLPRARGMESLAIQIFRTKPRLDLL